MKKTALLSIIAVLLISGCSGKNTTAAPAEPAVEEKTVVPAEADLVIGDKLFIGQVNDVYRNGKDYLGKTIRLEGIFKYGEFGGRSYCYVIRNGPGCCGDDGQVGFEVSWNSPDNDSEGDKKAYPKTNDWVEAQGELKKYNENGSNFLYIALSDIKVMEKRGAEFVSQ